ncbi:hypothetical protein KW796_00140 [Candidatus Parcubacteria bacterium]|nr:hypothetical protein [Candidatus Parcubacteria bacterium]
MLALQYAKQAGDGVVVAFNDSTDFYVDPTDTIESARARHFQTRQGERRLNWNNYDGINRRRGFDRRGIKFLKTA